MSILRAATAALSGALLLAPSSGWSQSTGAASTPASAPALRRLPENELRTLAAVYQSLQQDLYPRKSDEALVFAAIRGMVREVDPEGGEVFSEEEYRAYNAPPSRDSGSVGLELARRGDAMVVTGTIVGSPAEAAGLRPGDLIEEVDGNPVAGSNTAVVLTLLRGPIGTRVAFRLRRDDVAGPFVVEVVRATIKTPRVALSRPRPDIVWLRIPAFNEEALRDAAAGLAREWSREPFKGVLLDLRHCPGGLLESAIGIAAMFLPPRAVVGSTVGRAPDTQVRFLADPGYYTRRNVADPLAALPQEARQTAVVVLVDEATASGAEIVAAALHDQHRATIVGRRTFGRASIQTLRLVGKSAIRFTSAYWEPPSGTSFNKSGVLPDVVVEKGDAQRELEVAVAELGRMK